MKYNFKKLKINSYTIYRIVSQTFKLGSTSELLLFKIGIHIRRKMCLAFLKMENASFRLITKIEKITLQVSFNAQEFRTTATLDFKNDGKQQLSFNKFSLVRFVTHWKELNNRWEAPTKRMHDHYKMCTADVDTAQNIYTIQHGKENVLRLLLLFLLLSCHYWLLYMLLLIYFNCLLIGLTILRFQLG